MTGRRPYRLGKRAASVAETKRRILDAATIEYQDNGIEGTSMQAVARRADVAPGTVLYHYPTPEELADAVVESWKEQIGMPSPDDIDGEADLETRIRQLVAALYRLYEESGQAYQIFRKSPQHPAMLKNNRLWQETFGQMLYKALGDLADDAETMAVISVLIDPGFRGTMVSRGVAEDRAVEIAAELTLSRI